MLLSFLPHSYPCTQHLSSDYWNSLWIDHTNITLSHSQSVFQTVIKVFMLICKSDCIPLKLSQLFSNAKIIHRNSPFAAVLHVYHPALTNSEMCLIESVNRTRWVYPKIMCGVRRPEEWSENAGREPSMHTFISTYL